MIKIYLKVYFSMLLMAILITHSSGGYVLENCGIKDKESHLAINIVDFDMPTHIHLSNLVDIKYSVTALPTKNPLPKYLVLKTDVRKQTLGLWLRLPFCVKNFGTCQYVLRDEKSTNKKLEKILNNFKNDKIYKHSGIIPMGKVIKSAPFKGLIVGEYLVDAELYGGENEKDLKKHGVLACVRMLLKVSR